MLQPAQIFKRLVLGLQPSPPDHTVKLGVEFANLLHLDLLGLFLEDAGLRQLAHIPFVRELRSLGGGWQPIELDRLSRELELAARNTERLFTEAAKFLATKHRFEVVRGSTAETIASLSRADDIVMLAEPSSSADQATQQFSSFTQAALRSTASVMFIPRKTVRSAGAVAAVALSADDPSIQAGREIAVATGEELIVIEIGKNGVPEQDFQIRAADPGARRITVDARALTDTASFAHALHDIQARLLVVTRGVMGDEMARSIASLWRLPVLMTEPRDPVRLRSVR